MSVTELASFPEVRIGHVGPVLVSVWYDQATLRGVKAMAEQQRGLIGRYTMMTSLSVAVKVPKAPEPDVTAWLKESDAAFKAMTRGSVIVVLERGLAAIVVRTFLAAASLISTNVMQVVKTMAEATDRVKALPGQDLEVINDAQLAAKLEAFVALPPPTA